jgi:hypothetical protein
MSTSVTTARAAGSTALWVCPVAELPPGARRIGERVGHSIGVFNVGRVVHALRYIHALHGDALGAVVLARPGEIVRCPWLGWNSTS